MKCLRFAVLIVCASAGLTAARALDARAQTKTPAPAAKPKWVAPVKGVAEIGYLPPQTKIVKDEVITTIKVKNLSTGAIAGLRVDEYWWDKANTPVGGDSQRVRKLIMPGEVIEITLRTPKNAKMFRNNYQFTHANGQIKAKVLKKL